VTAPTPAVGLLRRAAERLRDPGWRTNNPAVDLAVADWLDAEADAFDLGEKLAVSAVAVARAVLDQDGTGDEITDAINADPDEAARLRKARQDARQGLTVLRQRLDEDGAP
jgi:hypothetical protein